MCALSLCPGVARPLFVCARLFLFSVFSVEQKENTEFSSTRVPMGSSTSAHSQQLTPVMEATSRTTTAASSPATEPHILVVNTPKQRTTPLSAASASASAAAALSAHSTPIMAAGGGAGGGGGSSLGFELDGGGIIEEAPSSPSRPSRLAARNRRGSGSTCTPSLTAASPHLRSAPSSSSTPLISPSLTYSLLKFEELKTERENQAQALANEAEAAAAAAASAVALAGQASSQQPPQQLPTGLPAVGKRSSKRNSNGSLFPVPGSLFQSTISSTATPSSLAARPNSSPVQQYIISAHRKL